MWKIALLPLDSRPCCQQFPQLIANIAGAKLVTPQIELLGKFTEPGSCEAVSSWLRSAAEEADGIVVSADQLAYGGLIASRTHDRTLEDALRTLDVLRDIKTRYPAKPIYVSSVLMRIGITGKNAQFAQYLQLVFEYCQLHDRINRLKETGLEEPFKRVKEQIPEEVLSDFFKARERNMHIHKLLIDWAASGAIDFLTITQEDASPVGLHVSEQYELQRYIYERSVQAKTMIYPGADEAAQTLLARLLQNLQQKRIKVYPQFTSESAKLAVAPYEDRPINESVKLHLWAAGTIVVETPNEADFILSVSAPMNHASMPASGLRTAFFDSRHMLTDLVEKVKYDLSAGRRVAIADVGLPNTADIELIQYLLDERLFTQLSGYAGWNTAGNALGTCIAHAVARTLNDKDDGENSKEADHAHYSFLMSRLMDEWGYQAQVRDQVNDWVTKHTSVSPWNLESDYEVVNEQAVLRMNDLFAAVKQRLLEAQQASAAAGCREWIDAELTFVQLPWNRTFEIDVRVEVKLK